MKSEFRNTSVEEAPAVAAFLCRIFGIAPNLPLVEPRHLKWKCWEERSDWPGSRGYVISKEDRYLAHGTVVPLACLSGGRRLRMVHLIDWIADPQSVGSGVVLLRQIARSVDAILVVGGSEMTQKVLPALGARSCGTVTRFARPLRPLRRLSGQKPGWRAGAQFARSLLWWLTAPGSMAQGWAAKQIAPEGLASQNIPWPRATAGTAVFERTAESASYLLKCPAAPMELFSVSKDRINRGYFILAHVPGQVRIADFHADTEDAGSWRAVIELAVSQAIRNPAAAEVAAVGSDPVTRQALADCGFHAREDFELRLLSISGAVLPEGPIRFQMVDSDAAYLHENKIAYWA